MDTKVKNGLIIGGSFVGGFALGGLVGYVATRRHAADFFAEVTRQEIEAVKEYYEGELEEAKSIGLEPDPGLDSDEVIIEDIDPNTDYDAYLTTLTHAGYQGDEEEVRKMFDEQFPIKAAIERIISPEVVEAVEVEMVAEDKRTNIFKDEAPILDTEMAEYDEYMQNRDPKSPHVIHINDFMDTNTAPYAAYNKIVLHYYEGDGTLTDERNVPIADVERLVGPEALTMFGKFSGDNTLVYARNTRKDVESDFEIHRKNESFSEHVLGVRQKNNRFGMKEDD